MSESESGQPITLSEQPNLTPRQEIINYLSDPQQGALRREVFADYTKSQRINSRSRKVKQNVLDKEEHEKMIAEKKKPGSEYEAEFNRMDGVVRNFKSEVFTRKPLDDITPQGTRLSDADLEITKQFEFASKLAEISGVVERRLQ
jgi:hypothetical protein